MTIPTSAPSAIPRPLVIIAAVGVAVAAVCSYLYRYDDKHAGPGQMSPEAIAQRLQPVAHVVVVPEKKQP